MCVAYNANTKCIGMEQQWKIHVESFKLKPIGQARKACKKG